MYDYVRVYEYTGISLLCCKNNLLEIPNSKILESLIRTLIGYTVLLLQLASQNGLAKQIEKLLILRKSSTSTIWSSAWCQPQPSSLRSNHNQRPKDCSGSTISLNIILWSRLSHATGRFISPSIFVEFLIQNSRTQEEWNIFTASVQNSSSGPEDCWKQTTLIL